ncbi:MAG TPA: hypothetical protein VLX29_02570, partial [Nitrospirota bacterium]|nr:hypothetical protein [Nitrospirota bacterium]
IISELPIAIPVSHSRMRQPLVQGNHDEYGCYHASSFVIENRLQASTPGYCITLAISSSLLL